MNAKTVDLATEIDYFITNAPIEKSTAEWIVTTYSQGNWVEVFYRTVKGWLVNIKCQLRGKKSIERYGNERFLCLYFYSLALVNWWSSATMG